MNFEISDVTLLSLLPKKADLAALKNDRFLIRWAAQSARISDVGTPQTFSVYDLKNWLKSQLPKRFETHCSKFVLLALRLDRRPQVGDQRLGQVDRAELLDHVRTAQRVVEELALPLGVRQ